VALFRIRQKITQWRQGCRANMGKNLWKVITDPVVVIVIQTKKSHRNPAGFYKIRFGQMSLLIAIPMLPEKITV
jgi:hypothetical protein